jgi:hypothetical protein
MAACVRKRSAQTQKLPPPPRRGIQTPPRCLAALARGHLLRLHERGPKRDAPVAKIVAAPLASWV